MTNQRSLLRLLHSLCSPDAVIKGTSMVPLHRETLFAILELFDVASEAMRPFADLKAANGDDFSGYPDEVVIRFEATAGEIRRLREALLRLQS